jgi:hypothetical protein
VDGWVFNEGAAPAELLPGHAGGGAPPPARAPKTDVSMGDEEEEEEEEDGTGAAASGSNAAPSSGVAGQGDSGPDIDEEEMVSLVCDRDVAGDFPVEPGKAPPPDSLSEELTHQGLLVILRGRRGCSLLHRGTGEMVFLGPGKWELSFIKERNGPRVAGYLSKAGEPGSGKFVKEYLQLTLHGVSEAEVSRTPYKGASQEPSQVASAPLSPRCMAASLPRACEASWDAHPCLIYNIL